MTAEERADFLLTVLRGTMSDAHTYKKIIATEITAACEAAVENAYGPSRIAFYEKGFAEARERAAEFVDKHFDNTTSQWISQRIRALTPDRQEKI